MGEKEQWFDNKALYLMINDLRDELAKMIQIAKEYNDLRGALNDCIKRVTAIEERQAGKYAVGKAIREWGGWITGLIMFLITIYTVIRYGVG
jgi:hypothetical protein